MTTLTAGVDVGAATTKAAIIADGNLLSYFIMPTGAIVESAAMTVAEKVMNEAGIAMNDLNYVIATGWGRQGVPFANKTVTEIICHAAGAHWLIPETRSIIDIGGQDSKAMTVDDNGTVLGFVMNDKCAAGTGRFLEVMAQVLETTVEKLGPIALNSEDPCQISSTCTIFAETEVIALRAQGRNREDLVAGILAAVAKRVALMAQHLKLGKELVFTGGVAKNIGVKKALENELGTEMLVSEEPQIIGALGAALLAKKEALKLSN